MVKFDRSKYKASSSEEMAKESEKMEERSASSRGAYLKVEPGINSFRIFPAPIKAKSSLFCFPKVTSFLPFLIDETDKNGQKTGNQVEKRKPVFNAKVHANLDHDIVEEYIQAVRDKYSAIIQDKKKLLEKIKPLTDWKTGIRPSSSWIVYAYKKVGDKKVYGRLQITDGVKKQMDTLCLREGESGKPIVVDLFSDPDNGKMLQWVSDPKNEDPKAKNKVTIISEKDCPLTDEELEWLESQDSLESLYRNSYSESDFEKQLKGLQYYDKKNKLEVFSLPSFQSIIEVCKEEVDSIGKSNSNKDISNSNESTVKIPTILSEMDKKTLMEVIKVLELKVNIKLTTPPSKIRLAIVSSIIKEYELKGDDISNQISNIVEEAFEEDNEEDKNKESDLIPDSAAQESNEEDSESENNSEESENDSEESEVDSKEEEIENISKESKRSSLLEKYRKHNSK